MDCPAGARRRAGAFSVRVSIADGGDFVAEAQFSSGFNLTRLFSLRVTCAQCVWREDPGVACPWVGPGVRFFACRLAHHPVAHSTRACCPRDRSNAVGLQVTVQIWFAIGTTIAILSLDRAERMAAEAADGLSGTLVLRAQRQESLARCVERRTRLSHILTAVRGSAELRLDDVTSDAPVQRES